MISWYNQLWLSDRGPVSKISGLGLFALSIGFPIIVALFWYNPKITLIGFGIVGVFIGLTLFFNITNFAIFVFPLIFAVTIHHFILMLCILLFVSFLAGRLLGGQLSIEVGLPVKILIILLSGIMGVSRAWDPDLGRYAFQYYLLIPVLVFIVFYNLRPSNRQIALNLLVICIVGAIIGWSSMIRYFFVGWTRTIIGWGHYNPAACFFGMIMPYALLSVLYSKRPLYKFGWWIILLGLFAGLFVTQSRAGYLISSISMFYLAWKDKRILRVMMPIILAGLIIVPTLLLYRLMMVFGVGLIPDWSSVGRVQIWLNSMILIPKYYLFGMGIESFRFVYPIIFPEAFIRAEHPHNVYLRYLFEYGLVGLLAYMSIFFGVLLRSFKAIVKLKKETWTQDERLLLSLHVGFLAALIAAAVGSPFHHPQVIILMWMFIAFQLLLLKRLRKDHGA